MGRSRWTMPVLRVGMGLFLVMWGVDKLAATEGSVGIFSTFYGLDVGADSALPPQRRVGRVAVVAPVVGRHGELDRLLLRRTRGAVGHRVLAAQVHLGRGRAG